MKLIIYSAAVAAALATVLATRLLIPAAVLVFKAIEAAYEPADVDDSTTVLTALPVAVTEAPAPVAPKKPRSARRRKPSKQTLAAIEAIA
jgi:hypothetical protein